MNINLQGDKIIMNISKKENKFYKLTNIRLIGVVLALNIICPIFYFFVCEVHFDTETDLLLNNVLAGTLGEYGSGYGKVNIVLGYSIKLLYSMFNMIPWYTILQYICVCISFVCLIYVVLKRNYNWGGMATSIVLLLLLGYECYARVAYVKTSIVCVCVACFLLFKLLLQKTCRIIWIIMTIALFLAGYLWWKWSVIVCFGIMIIPLMSKILKTRQNWKLNLKRLILVCCTSVLIIVGIEVGTNIYFSQHSDVKEYVSYLETWDYINKRGWPDYTSHQNEFENLGLTENTYYALTQNTILPGSTNTLETIENIKEYVTGPEIYLGKILDFTRVYPLHFLETGLFLGFLMLLLLFGISETKKKKWIVFYLFIVSGVLYFIAFLYWMDNVEIVRTVIWMILCITIINFIEKIELQNESFQKYYSFVLGIFLILILNQEYDSITEKTAYDSERYDVLGELISSDKDNIYMTDNTEFYRANLPFDSLQKGEYENILIAKVPFKMYNSANVENAILNNLGDIRFLSEGYANQVAIYLNENYGGDYNVVKAGSAEDMSFFSVRSSDYIVQTEDIIDAGEEIKSDLKMYDNENDQKIIEGYAYKENTNSFAQKCYIEMYNQSEDIYSYIDIEHSLYADGKDKMNGQYSWVYGEIPEIEDCDYSLILETEGKMYRVPIDS